MESNKNTRNQPHKYQLSVCSTSLFLFFFSFQITSSSFRVIKLTKLLQNSQIRNPSCLFKPPLNLMLSCHTMSISVELPVFKSFPSLSPPHYSSKPVFYNSFFCFGKQNLKCKWRAYVGVTMSKDKSCPSIVCQNDSEKFVEVIGIGSKKDSLLDLCLESPFNSSSLRFWYVH